MRTPGLLALLLVTACGTPSHSAADAGGGGGGGGGGDGADAGPDSSERGTVTVITRSPGGDGTPVAMIPVVFTDPDGTIVAKVMTDAQGVAQADVLPGATVTAVFAGGLGGRRGTLVGSVMAVNPGDRVQIGWKNPPPATTLGTMTINYPALAGATSYKVINSCTVIDTTSTSVTIPFSNRCERDTYDVLVLARDKDLVLLGVATKSGVTFTDGGTITVPDNYQAPGEMQYQVTGVPDGATNLILERANLSLGRRLFWLSTLIPQPAQGESSGSVTSLPGGDQAQVTVSFNSPLQHHVQERLPVDASSYSLDLGADALPVLELPTYDKNKREIDWTAAEGGSKADAFLAVARLRRTTPAEESFEWYIVGPGSLTAVALPALPDDLADTLPTTGDSLQLGLFLGDASDIASYDDDRDTIYPDIEQIVFGGYDADRIDWIGGFGTVTTL